MRLPWIALALALACPKTARARDCPWEAGDRITRQGGILRAGGLAIRPDGRLHDRLLACGFERTARRAGGWRAANAALPMTAVSSGLLLFPPATAAGVVGLVVVVPVAAAIRHQARRATLKVLAEELAGLAPARDPDGADSRPPAAHERETPAVATSPELSSPGADAWGGVPLDAEAIEDLLEVRSLLADATALISIRGQADAAVADVPRARAVLHAHLERRGDLQGWDPAAADAQRALAQQAEALLDDALREAEAALVAPSLAQAQSALAASKAARSSASDVARQLVEAFEEQARLHRSQEAAARRRDARLNTGSTLLVVGTGVLATGAVATLVGHAEARPDDPLCVSDPVMCAPNPAAYFPGVALGALGLGLGLGGAVLLATPDGRLELQGRF